MASLHAFASRYSLNLYIAHYKRSFASCQFPLPPVGLVLLAKFLPQFEDHKWFTEFHAIDNCRTFRGLLRPEAYVSIRYDTIQIAITGLHCHFGSCVSSCFHMSDVTTLLDTSPFGSPCVLFPGGLGLSGSVLRRFVLRALHKSVARNAHQSRDVLNG